MAFIPSEVFPPTVTPPSFPSDSSHALRDPISEISTEAESSSFPWPWHHRVLTTVGRFPAASPEDETSQKEQDPKAPCCHQPLWGFATSSLAAPEGLVRVSVTDMNVPAALCFKLPKQQPLYKKLFVCPDPCLSLIIS
jgi:hypothetical protein